LRFNLRPRPSSSKTTDPSLNREPPVNLGQVKNRCEGEGGTAGVAVAFWPLVWRRHISRETDLALRLGRRRHYSPDDVEASLELGVACPLRRFQLAGQLGVGGQPLPPPHRCAHQLRAGGAARSLFSACANINAPCSVKA